MRPVWKGALSFGLVNIPVRLYVATRRDAPQFRLLHRQCHTPVQYRKWCPHCDRELEPEEIGRGIEIDTGQYVVIRDEELEELPLPTARTIQIMDFVELSDIDPVYYDRTYYIEPAEGASRPYRLLRTAMAQTNRTAVAKVLLRTKESLAGVRIFGQNLLVLHTMHYSSDVREPVVVEGVQDRDEIDRRELEMARTLIDNLTTSFDPGRYHSEYRQALAQLIETRVSGAEVVTARPDQPKVVDLMQALRESVKQTEQERRAGTGP